MTLGQSLIERSIFTDGYDLPIDPGAPYSMDEDGVWWRTAVLQARQPKKKRKK